MTRPASKPEWQDLKQMKRSNHTGKNNTQKMIAFETFSRVKHFLLQIKSNIFSYLWLLDELGSL